MDIMDIKHEHKNVKITFRIINRLFLIAFLVNGRSALVGESNRYKVLKYFPHVKNLPIESKISF